MIDTTLLSKEEFEATYRKPAKEMPMDGDAPFDFWPYFEAIPDEDFEDVWLEQIVVDSVFRMKGNRFEHVLIQTSRKNTFMVLVLDLKREIVVGHHLLNLNETYGFVEEDSMKKPPSS